MPKPPKVDDHAHCDEDPIECSHEVMVGQLEEFERWVIAERDKLCGRGATDAHASAFTANQAGITVLDAVQSRMKALGLWWL